MTMGGNESKMIGEFTRYEKKTMSFPSAANTASTWTTGAVIPCSFAPKMIVVTGGTEKNNNIVMAVVCFDLGGSVNLGATHGFNGSGTAIQTVFAFDSTSSSGRFYYNELKEEAYIARATSAVYWSNSDTYTVEIYG